MFFYGIGWKFFIIYKDLYIFKFKKKPMCILSTCQTIMCDYNNCKLTIQ